MINKLFYSSNNKYAIKSIINEDIKINNNYDMMINDTMDYVISQVNKEPPKGMKSEEYIFLMNKKVYDIVTPIILTSEKNKKTKPIKKEDVNNIFDPLLLKNFETPSVVMEYPKPSIIKNNIENIDTQIKKVENERATLVPKIRPIDFTIKEDNNVNKNTVQMYNELLTNYNSFENNQKNMNENIQSNINENDYSFTPIDILQNKNNYIETFTSNETSSYNRNNIETFINNDLKINPNEVDLRNTGENFSSVNTIGSSVLIDEPKMNIIEKKFILTIDSADRDLYEYPLQTLFQVKLAPAGNNLIYNSYYDEYNTLILLEKTISYGDGSNASINETFDNIRSIKLTNVNVPNTIIYVDGIEDDPGISQNIFKDSYTYLVIPELRGPYKSNNTLSNNAFAKLIIPTGSNSNSSIKTYYILLTTSNPAEYFIYDPVLNGKMDKMTLNFLNKNGKLFNFGIDKLYVEKFMEGTYKYYGNCGDKYLTTRLLIQNKNDEYRKYCSTYYPNSSACNYLNSNPLQESDLLYFYYTRPNYDQIIYLEDYINISKLTYDFVNFKLKISAYYTKIIENGETKNIQINFKDIIQGGIDNNYYIILFDKKMNKYYYLKVDSFSGKSIIVIYKNTVKIPLSEYKNIRIGISKSNLRGTNNDDNQSLFYNGGYYTLSKGNVDGLDNIISIDNTSFIIEINYPYDKLPEYLKDDTKYMAGEIFLIQEKMQISYTFEITSMVKDYSIVSSKLNESGSN